MAHVLHMAVNHASRLKQKPTDGDFFTEETPCLKIIKQPFHWLVEDWCEDFVRLFVDLILPSVDLGNGLLILAAAQQLLQRPDQTRL